MNKNNFFQRKYALYITVLISLIALSLVVFTTSDNADDFCKNYDWGVVEELVEPYLDEVNFTALVMQGLSSEYNTSVAASQAMDSQLPEDVLSTLNKIVTLNCP